ncbi:hypothetical protein ACFYNA_15095 [Streptomyces sp. NPDC006640]|uniref:hypothetical protein n=1 Tax=Streptomyces sp. NPDC006640 TaxID=3364754 RepID=UPI0036BBB69B
MPCRVSRALARHLGRRGTGLLIAGAGLSCWGIGILLDPPPTQGLRLLTDLCGIQNWAWLWIAAGVLALAAAFARIGPDWPGFGVAFLPPMVWATAYAVAAINGEYSRGGFIAGWYLAIAGLILWAATVPEYSVPPPPRRAQKREGP